MEHVQFLLRQINRFKFMFHTLSGCSPKCLLICCIANLLTQVDRFYIFPFQRAFGPLLQNKIRLLLKKKISLVSTLLNNHNDFIALGFWCGILWFNWCQKLDNNLFVYYLDINRDKAQIFQSISYLLLKGIFSDKINEYSCTKSFLY